LFEFFKEKRDLIESQLGYSLVFEIGGKQDNIKWVKHEWSFAPNDEDDYKRVLRSVLPYMVRFVETFEPFIK
jgi:hypothetical protein